MAQINAQAAGAVTLPVSGTVVNASAQVTGQFNGSFTVNSFATIQGGGVVAVGMLRGSVTNTAGQVVLTGLTRVILPAVLSQLTAGNMQAPFEFSGGPRVVPASLTTAGRGRFTRVQFGGCGGGLHVGIGSAAAVNFLGSSVTLSPMFINVASDAAGVGGLVCQIVGLLGGLLDVTGLLNNLLGTVTGLLGGATGGLLGGIL